MTRPVPRSNFRMAQALMRVLGGEVARVGTQNQAKLGAVRSALASFAADASVLRVEGASVSSGVAEQPIGWDEIATGARHRAQAAFELGGAALAFGIEDGLVRVSSESPIFNVGCAWVTDGERASHGFSSGFAYPPGCLETAFASQEPIGDLFDALWREKRAPEAEAGAVGAAAGSAGAEVQQPAEAEASGRRGGNIGMLTQGRLDRTAYGAQAVTCALMAFLHTDLYD